MNSFMSRVIIYYTFSPLEGNNFETRDNNEQIKNKNKTIKHDVLITIQTRSNDNWSHAILRTYILINIM